MDLHSQRMFKIIFLIFYYELCVGGLKRSEVKMMGEDYNMK